MPYQVHMQHQSPLPFFKERHDGEPPLSPFEDLLQLQYFFSHPRYIYCPVHTLHGRTYDTTTIPPFLFRRGTPRAWMQPHGGPSLSPRHRGMRAACTSTSARASPPRPRARPDASAPRACALEVHERNPNGPSVLRRALSGEHSPLSLSASSSMQIWPRRGQRGR